MAKQMLLITYTDVRAGGRGGLQLSQLQKLRNFSGKPLMIRATTLERKHYWQNNTVGMISKSRESGSYFLCLSVTLDARPRVCTPSSDFLRELVPKVVPRKVHHLYILLIWSIVVHRRRHGYQSWHRPSLSFPAFPLGFKACKLLSLTFSLQKRA